MSTLILSASPKLKGNSMQVAKTLHESIKDSHIVSLADYNIMPCIDCGFCKKNKAKCSLDKIDSLATKDDCSMLFDLCFKASRILIVSPIYFYHAPAKFKALIDRSQAFWHNESDSIDKNTSKYTKEMHAIYIAARTKGEKLSQALDLTLKYFAPMLQCDFISSTCLYGLEKPEDFLSTSLYAQEAREKISKLTQILSIDKE